MPLCDFNLDLNDFPFFYALACAFNPAEAPLRFHKKETRYFKASDLASFGKTKIKGVSRSPAKPRRFWTRPRKVVEEEWRENFRMSRTSLYALAVKLRPYIQGQKTRMRSAIDVVQKVAITLYYLSDKGRFRKTVNAFGIS